MIRRLFNLVHGSTPAEFECGFSLDESVRRLANATRRSVFFEMKDPQQ
jgi:hypothetical protein